LPFMPKAGYAWFKRSPGDAAWKAASDQWSTRDGNGEGEDAWVRLALRGRDPFLDGNQESVELFQQLATDIFQAVSGADPSPGPADD